MQQVTYGVPVYGGLLSIDVPITLKFTKTNLD